MAERNCDPVKEQGAKSEQMVGQGVEQRILGPQEEEGQNSLKEVWKVAERKETEADWEKEQQ